MSRLLPDMQAVKSILCLYLAILYVGIKISGLMAEKNYKITVKGLSHL